MIYTTFLNKGRLAKMYRAQTHDIEITVEPFYLESQSEPDDNRFVWGYRVVIVNHSDQRVQLRDRYWRITDGMGQVGVMVGQYRMEGTDGKSFLVDIPAFSLDLPNAVRTLN